MLKPGDSPVAPDDRPVGDLVHQLVEDGKAYAKAELAVAKAIAGAKAGALRLPAILIGAAFLFLQAGVTVLAVAVYLSLMPLVGPFFAGLFATLLFVGVAGGLAWLAVRKLKEDL